MEVNDNAGHLTPHVVRTTIASKLAPTGTVYTSRCWGDCKIAFAGKSNRRTAAPTGTAPTQPNHKVER